MMRGMRALISAFVAVNMLMLAGCAQEPKYVPLPTAEPFCRAVQTVCISKDDQLTEPTAQQIEANNLGHSRICKRRVTCGKESKPTS